MPTDIIGWVTSATGLAIIAIAAVLIGWGFIDLTKNQRTRKAFKGLAVLAVLGFLVVNGAFGSGLVGTTATATSATYAITASEDTDQAWVVINDDTNTVQIQIDVDDVNETFDAQTGTAEINFTIGRTDSSSADAVATADLGVVGLILDSSGNGKTYPVLAQNSDGTYAFDWEKGPNANAVVINKYTTQLVEGGGTAFLRLNVTFNGEAGAQMDIYDVGKVTFVIATETWTLEILKVDGDFNP